MAGAIKRENNNEKLFRMKEKVKILIQICGMSD